MNTASPAPFAAVVALTFSLTLAGCAGGSEDAPPSQTSGDPVPTQSDDASSGQPSPAPSASTTGLPEDADLSRKSPRVTPDEAIATAQKAAGDGTLHAIELDYDRRDGAWQYEVKILKDRTDFDIDVDAETGKIVKNEKDTTNDSEKAIDLKSPMIYGEAFDLASDQGKGRLTGWKLESDDDRTEYQFDFDDNGTETEVSVDVDSKRVTVDG
ncbi:PepSY domain-containing protein [Brevibacterium metallidurans]|uniref:PepSY domain-containing protein n=1 Tax=Brevibacterium metallidurans TaxID=1482676 RepID=A0ABP3CDR6_9MICO